MTALDYCERADLYAFGLPRGSIPNEGRLLAASSASANTLTLDEHGLSEDTPHRFRGEAGGVLPEPLAEGVTYYAHPLTDSTFQVRATAGGSAIDLTTAGDPERVLLIVPLPVESWITWASRLIDEMIPAHVVPLGPTLADVPLIVRSTCAELAAGKGLGYGGAASKTLTEMVKDARNLLATWAKGVPVRGPVNQQPANLAVTGAPLSVPHCDPRGWGRFGGL